MLFRCEKCGMEIDRDFNATLNIKRVGVDILYNRIQRDEVASLDEVSRTE